MKKFFLLCLILLFSESLLFSQIAINPNGTPPHPSAGLDVNFPDKGFLLPRMTFEERNDIPAPAEGLMIYCTDCNSDGSGALSIYKGGVWRVFNLGCTTPDAPLAGTHVPTAIQITWNWNTVPIAEGYKWGTTNDFGSAIDLGPATSTTEMGLTCWTEYTRYVWAYNGCGESFPLVMTQSTLDIPFSTAPVEGEHGSNENMIIWTWLTVPGAAGYKWNTTNNYNTAQDMGSAVIRLEAGLTCNTVYTRYVWAYDDCGYSAATTLTKATALDPPVAPEPGTNTPSVTQIVWDWNPVTGATGYKWNTINDYETALEKGTNTNHTETGLTCNTPYTRYVWAYSNCGVSVSTTLTQNTSPDPPAAPVAGTLVPSPTQIVWNWNTVPLAAGYKWNTTDNFSTATDMGTNTTYTETGLTCNTPVTRYVWAYNSCGVSTSTSLNQTTSLDPPDAPTAGTHVPSPTQIVWNWTPVDGATEYKWNTSDNYGTAIDMGTSTSHTETGLVCNTPYTRYIWAYSDCGVSASTSLSQVTSSDIPPAPTAGTHVPSPTQIVWNWNTVTGATGYKWSTTNDYGTAIDVGLNLSRTETGLTCNSAYTRYVWAYNSCDHSVSTTLAQTTSLDPPAAPVAGTHVPSPTQVVWNWNIVPAAAGYKWNTTNNYGTAIDMGTSTTRTETGLTCNTAYNRYVWAYNSCGVSIATTLTQTTSLDPPASPTAATHVPTPTQVTWKWHPVSGATGYRWHTTNNYANSTDMGTDTSRIETGLSCNTSYTRYIWAYSSCGNSSSTSISQTTSLSPPAAPVAGTHVPSATQIVWNWNPVSGATGYKWNTTDNYATAIEMGTNTTRTETGLTCNTPYLRYVWAYSSCGVSVSTELSQTTSLNPPAAPTAGTHVPSVTQIVWNWNTVSGATGYKWNTTNNYATATDMGVNTTRTETGLVCNTAYTRYVWAYSLCGVSTATTLTQSTSTNPPAAPATASHIPTPTQVQWNWHPVPAAAGYKWNTSNNYGTAIEMGTDTLRIESGLTCNTEYTRFVWSYNSCGVSTAATLTQFTSLDPPDAPAAGTHVASATQIIWNWNTVSGATGYKWNTTNSYGSATDMGTNTSWTETGLSCNAPYTRFVWAYSPCGVSDPTTLNQSTTNEPPAAPVAATHVPAPTQIEWKWHPVTGATGYKWSLTDDFGTATENGSDTSEIQTGLTCNTPYTLYVWAYSSCGNSATATLTQTTALDPPDSPVAAAHVAALTEITWNWNTVANVIGYRWSNLNDFATATEMGLLTTKIEDTLTCGNSYARYVWAYNGCGYSAPVMLTQSILA